MGYDKNQTTNPTNSDIRDVDTTKGENIHSRALQPDLSWQDRQSDIENGMTHNVPYRPTPVYGGTGVEQLLFNAEYNSEHGYDSPVKQSGVVGLNDSTYDQDIRRESELEDLNEFRANSQRWWEQLGGGLGRFATITSAGVIQNTVGTVAGIVGGLSEGIKGNQEQIVDENGRVWDVDADGHKVIKDENGKMWLCDDDGNILTDENGNPIESKAKFSGFWGRFFNGFINNEVNTYMNDWIEAANEAMPVYRTKQEQEAGLLESIWSSGFWADQVANLGWTSAAIISTVLTGGLGAASLVGNLTRNLLKSPRAAQFMYRLIGGITGSMAEASTEAIGAYNKGKGEFNKRAIDKYKSDMKTIDEAINEETIEALNELGVDPRIAPREVIESVREKIFQNHLDEINKNFENYKFNVEGFEKSARNAALNTFGSNVLVLSLTNTIGTFSNITTPFSNANRIAKGSAKNLFLESGEKIGITKGELYARKAAEIISQGNEEMLQAIATDAAVNYEAQKYDPNNVGKFKSYMDIAGEAFVGNLSSVDSWKEFAAGLITGVAGAPGMGHKHTNKEEKSGDMGSKTGIRPNWTGGIWGMKSEVEEEFNTSADIYGEYNNEYNNLYQSDNLRAKTAMLIGTIGDNDAMGEAAKDNDKKAYMDKEGEKLLRTVESFANVGRLGELSSLVGEDINMTDEQLEEFAAMNSEEIKDSNGNGTGKFKSSLPVVDSNGELITNTKEGREKLRERLKKDQAKAQKLIKEYAKVIEETDEITGYQLNREQLAMLAWMKMKGRDGETRQDDMTKGKEKIIKKFLEAYRRVRTYTDKNDDDYYTNLDVEAQYLHDLVSKYDEMKDDDMTEEDKQNKGIFKSELRRIRRAKEILSEEKHKLQREKKNREAKERDTKESSKEINAVEAKNRVEIKDEEKEAAKTQVEALAEVLINRIEKDPDHSGSIMAAVLGHKVGTRDKRDASGNVTKEDVYFAEVLKDILEKDNSLEEDEYADFVDYINDMIRIEQDKFAFDTMFRKLVGAPEHVRTYMDKVLEKVKNKKQKALNQHALEEYIKENDSEDTEATSPDTIIESMTSNMGLSEDEAKEARDYIVQNNEKARTAEKSRLFNKLLADIVESAKEDAETPEQVMLLNELVSFFEFRNYRDKYDFIYQTSEDFKKFLEEAYNRNVIQSIDNVVDMVDALKEMQDAVRKQLMQEIEMQKIVEQVQKKGTPVADDTNSNLQAVENPKVRDTIRDITKDLLSKRDKNKDVKEAYDSAIKTLVDYAKQRNISIPEKIETKEEIDTLIDNINAYARGTYSTDGDAYWFEATTNSEGNALNADKERENYVSTTATKAADTFNIVNAISFLTNGEFNLGKPEMTDTFTSSGKPNFDYTLWHIKDSLIRQSTAKTKEIQSFDLLSVPEGMSVTDFLKKIEQNGIKVVTVEYEPTDLVKSPFVLMESIGKPTVSTERGKVTDFDSQTIFIAVPKQKSSSAEQEKKDEEEKEQFDGQKPQGSPQENPKPSPTPSPVNDGQPAPKKDLSKMDATVKLIDSLIDRLGNKVFFDRKSHTYFLYTGENIEEAKTKFNNGEITRENAAENGFKVHDVSVSTLRYGQEDIRQSPELLESQQYGNDIDLIVREHTKGTPRERIKEMLVENGRRSKFYSKDENYPEDKNLNFDYVDDFIKQVEKAKNEIVAMYPECVFITSEISLAAWMKHVEGANLEEKQLLLAGQPDMLVVDKDGIVHVFDMKAKKIDGEKKEDILISETNKNEYNGKNDYERYTTQLLGYARMLEAYGIPVDTKNVNLIQFSTVKKKADDKPTFVGISTIDASKCKPAIVHTNDITSINLGEQQEQQNENPTEQTTPTIPIQNNVQGGVSTSAANAVSVENDNNNKTTSAISEDIKSEIKAVADAAGDNNTVDTGTGSPISLVGGDNEVDHKPTKEEFDSKQLGYVISDVLEYRDAEERKGVYKKNDSSIFERYLEKAGAYTYLNSGKLKQGAKVFLRTLEEEVNGPSDGTEKAMGVYVLDGKNSDGTPKFQIIGIIFDDSRATAGYNNDGKIDTSHNIRCNIGNAVTGMGPAFTRRNTNTEGSQILSGVAYLVDSEGNKREVNVSTKPIAPAANKHKKIVGKDQFGVERDFIPVTNTDNKRLVVASILLGRIQQNADIDNEKDHRPIREVTRLEDSFDKAFNNGEIHVGIITQNRTALLVDHNGNVVQDIPVSIPQKFPTGAAIVAFQDGKNNWRCSLVIGNSFNRNDLSTDNPICRKIQHFMSRDTKDNGKNGIVHRIDRLKNLKNDPLTTEATRTNLVNNLKNELTMLFNYMNRMPVVTIDEKTLIASFEFKLTNGETYKYDINFSTATDVESVIYDMMEKAGLRYSISQQIFLSDAPQSEKKETINGLVDLLHTNISDFSTRNTRFALSFENDFIVGEKDWTETPQKTTVPFGNNFIVKLNDYDGREGRISLVDNNGNAISNEDVAKELGYKYSSPEKADMLSNTMAALLNEIMKAVQQGKKGIIKVNSVNDRSDIVYFDMNTNRCVTDAEYNSKLDEQNVSVIIASTEQPTTTPQTTEQAPSTEITQEKKKEQEKKSNQDALQLEANNAWKEVEQGLAIGKDVYSILRENISLTKLSNSNPVFRQMVEEQKKKEESIIEEATPQAAAAQIQSNNTVATSDATPSNNKTKKNQSTDGVGRRRRRTLSVISNRTKNALLNKGAGKYNVKDLLREMDSDSAAFIGSIISDSMEMTVLSDEEFDNKYGVKEDGFYSRENGVVVRESCLTSTIIHELCHALVPNILQNEEAAEKLREIFKIYKQYLNLHSDIANRVYEGMSIGYSTKNVYEFLSELFSNDMVAEVLKSIPTDYFVDGGTSRYAVNVKYRDDETGLENKEFIGLESKKKNILSRIVDAIIKFFTSKVKERYEVGPNLYDMAEKAGKELMQSFSKNDTKNTESKKGFDAISTNKGLSQAASKTSDLFNTNSSISVKNITDAMYDEEGAINADIHKDNKNKTSSTMSNLVNVVTSISEVSPSMGDMVIFDRKAGNIYKGSVNEIPVIIDGNVDNRTNIKKILEYTLKRQLDSMCSDLEFKSDMFDICRDAKSVLSETGISQIDNISISGLTNIDMVSLMLTNPSFIGITAQITSDSRSILDRIQSSIIKYSTRNNGRVQKFSSNMNKLREIGNVNKNVELAIKLNDIKQNKTKMTRYSSKINKTLEKSIHAKKEGFIGAKKAIIKFNEAGILKDVSEVILNSPMIDTLDSQKQLFSLILPVINGRNYTSREIEDAVDSYNDYIYGYSSSHQDEMIKCLIDMFNDISTSSVILDGINLKNNVSNFAELDKSSIFADPLEESESKCNI